MRQVGLVTLIFTAGIAIGIAGQQIGNAQQTSDPRVADLVQSGKLRAGIGVVAPHWAIKDPQTGELRGVAVDIARALAKRLGVEMVAVEYPSPPKVLDGLNADAWDVGFLGIDPARAAVVDFSPPYLQIDATYLVPVGSSIRDVADVDQLRIRIGVSNKSVEDVVLSGSIKQAELRRVETMGRGFELLRAKEIDVLAAPRPTAILFSAQLPGSRVLEGRFHATFGAMAVPKGQTGRLAYISEFIEEAKASGMVRGAIERAKVHGVEVAPRGNAPTR